MKCPWCDAEVYQTARYGLYDVDRYRAHYCVQEPLPEPEREVWDTCIGCGGLWVRFGDGPRPDMESRQPHVCPVATPPPTAHRNGSVEPPSKPALAEVGMDIPI